MRTDNYTKTVLTVIAFMLTVIAFSEYLSPQSVAHAGGLFDGWQVSATPNGFLTFSSTGNVEKYELTAGPTVGQMTEKLVFSKRIDLIEENSRQIRSQINPAVRAAVQQQTAVLAKAALAKTEADADAKARAVEVAPQALPPEFLRVVHIAGFPVPQSVLSQGVTNDVIKMAKAKQLQDSDRNKARDILLRVLPAPAYREIYDKRTP